MRLVGGLCIKLEVIEALLGLSAVTTFFSLTPKRHYCVFLNSTKKRYKFSCSVFLVCDLLSAEHVWSVCLAFSVVLRKGSAP